MLTVIKAREGKPEERWSYDPNKSADTLLELH